MKSFLSGLDSPNILEIGIDKGQTLFPLLQFFSYTGKTFSYTGLDVLIRDDLKIPISYMDFKHGQDINLYNVNSLAYLPECKEKFDLILVDGDHNYYTVKQELKYLVNLCTKNTIMICDDYHGRWANADGYYSELDEYKNIDMATQRQETEKQGVNQAVNDFLAVHSNWSKAMPIKGEPILLFQKGAQSV
jgi:hypothetical protein